MKANIMVANKADEINKILKKNIKKNFIEDYKNKTKIKYKDLPKIIHCLSRELENQGFKKNCNIVLAIQDSWAKIILYFCFLHLKCKVFTIDYDNIHENDLTFIKKFKPNFFFLEPLLLNDKKFSKVITQKKSVFITNLNKNVQNNFKNINFEEILSKIKSIKKPTLNFQVNFEYLLINSSGTSGKYKVIKHSFKNLVKASNVIIEKYNIRNIRLLSVFSMSYMAGILNTIFISFFSQGTIIIKEKFNPFLAVNFWNEVKKYKINFLWLAPSMVEMLLKLDRVKDSSEIVKRVRWIFTATSKLEDQTYDDFKKKYKKSLLQTYGLSELLFVSSNQNEKKSNSTGKIFKGVQIKIKKNSELSIKSKFSFIGYWGRGNHEGWFDTGDLAIIDEFKNLVITGRSKDIIIRGGVNISPNIIEETIKKKTNNLNISVVGIKDKLYGEKICMVYKKNSVKKEVLKKMCNKYLNNTNQPDLYYGIDDFPKTVTGKIKKNKIIEIINTKK